MTIMTTDPMTDSTLDWDHGDHGRATEAALSDMAAGRTSVFTTAGDFRAHLENLRGEK